MLTWGSAVKLYRGVRLEDSGICIVEVGVDFEFRPLDLRLDLWNHSPTGFEWGYEGSGPAQLALAILADYLGNDRLAILHHQEFKRLVVGSLPKEGWELSGVEIEAAMRQLRLAG